MDATSKGNSGMITIKNYISMIYDDFREYIDQNVNLCMLKTLNIGLFLTEGTPSPHVSSRIDEHISSMSFCIVLQRQICLINSTEQFSRALLKR